MALPNPCILWPLRFMGPSYHLRVQTGAVGTYDAYTFTIPSTGVAVRIRRTSAGFESPHTQVRILIGVPDAPSDATVVDNSPGNGNSLGTAHDVSLRIRYSTMTGNYDSATNVAADLNANGAFSGAGYTAVMVLDGAFSYPYNGGDASWHSLSGGTGAGVETLTFPAAGSLTSGRNYWLAGDAQADADAGVGGVGDLVQMLAATLNSNTQGHTYAVAISPEGTVTIAIDSSTYQILWGDPATTLDPAIFGFTATTTPSPAAITASSPHRSMGLWSPGRVVTVDSRDRQPQLGGLAVALEGETRAANFGSPKKIRDLLWDGLGKPVGLAEFADATNPFGGAETMWLNALGQGWPVRYYEDASSRTSSSYSLYKTRSRTDPLVRSGGSNIRWKLDLRLRRAD